MNKEKNYDDIINTQWPQPSTRSRMPMKERAKIFLPFAALKGFEEAIDDVNEKVNSEEVTLYDEAMTDEESGCR